MTRQLQPVNQAPELVISIATLKRVDQSMKRRSSQSDSIPVGTCSMPAVGVVDAEVERFRSRPLLGNYPYLWLDATYLKVREHGRVVSMAVVLATTVHTSGVREVLGLEVGPSEDGAFWLAFLRELVARGLSGVQLVVSDAHEGFKGAIGAVLHGASWQRCRVHFVRNALALVPKHAGQLVAATIRTVFVQPDPTSRHEQWRRRRELANRLSRLKDLYQWGDLEPEEYPSERDELMDELSGLRSLDDQAEALERTAEYLADLPKAWRDATPEQRSELARVLFAGIRIRDKEVEALKPQPDFAPFFELDYFQRRAACGKPVASAAPRWIPILVPRPSIARTAIPPAQWADVQRRHASGESLRSLARHYAVSHEAIRGVLQRPIQDHGQSLASVDSRMP